jgi:hypothetical protein
LVKQHAGIQRLADSVRQGGGAVVGFCEAGAILHAGCWHTAAAQYGNKVNKDNNNYMTTTQQPTQKQTRQPTQRGNGIEKWERNYFFFSVQVCLNPWTVL